MTQKILLILMWVPMIFLGNILAGLFFKAGSIAHYTFFLVWPFVNFYTAYKVCEKEGVILVIRVVSFFVFESALVILLLRML